MAFPHLNGTLCFSTRKTTGNVWKTTTLSRYYQFVAKSLMKYGDSKDKPGDSYFNQFLSITHEIYKSSGDGFDVRSVFLNISEEFDKV